MPQDVSFLPLEKPSCYLWWLIPKSLWRRSVRYISDYIFYFALQDLYIPKDTVVNGSSWPMPLSLFFNPYGASFIAGSFHDMTYVHGLFLRNIKGKIEVLYCTRAEADHLWRALYIASNEPVTFNCFGRQIIWYRGVEISAWIGYFGLRLFGFFTWNKLAKDRKQANRKLSQRLGFEV